jgi:predicted nuclease of predicted toxin-antitoxin system
LKFLVDENVDISVSKALVYRGIDTLSVKVAGLLGASDDVILKFANNHDRIIVTQDADFLKFHSVNSSHKGMVFITRQMKVGDIVRGLEKVEILYNSEDMINNVLFLP